MTETDHKAPQRPAEAFVMVDGVRLQQGLSYPQFKASLERLGRTPSAISWRSYVWPTTKTPDPQ